VGERLPLYCTATGKAFLAYWPEEKVASLLAGGLIQYTENTLASLPELFQNLRETRERGFAISMQEFEKDINAVAAPIMDANGCPIAVIAIVGPSFRLSEDRMMKLGEAIRETTAVITREVGLAALPVILPKAATPYINGYSEKRG
jgi:DNA-binding IclR family transcriptional regulator